MRPPVATSPAARATLRALHLFVWSALLLTGPLCAWAATPPAAPSGLHVDTYPTPTSVQIYWISNSTNELFFCGCAPCRDFARLWGQAQHVPGPHRLLSVTLTGLAPAGPVRGEVTVALSGGERLDIPVIAELTH